MAQRTFSFDCADLSAAAEQLPMPTTHLPTVDEFHPLMATGEAIMLCVHDDTNQQTRALQVPSKLVESIEDGEELANLLRRVVVAEFN